MTDSGPGIPDDALARLFESLFSLKAYRIGLGLAVVKRTIDVHGGRVVASRGGGMTVQVELPLAGTHEAR